MKKYTWSPTWHETCNLPWSTGFVSSLCQRSESNTNPWDHNISQPSTNYSLLYGRTHVNRMAVIWLRVWLHMSLHYTCIEGPSPHKLNLVSHEHCMLRGCLQHGPWVIPRPCRICDWLLSLSRDHFGSHQGKNIRVTMEFEVPKRHSLRPTLSFDMVRHVLQWERQKRCSGRKTQGPMLEKCW
jgi:hypothetical protein